jgi:phage-related protein
MNWNMHMTGTTHPIAWIGPTQRELRTLPRPARRNIAHALYAAQHGVADPAAKPRQNRSKLRTMDIVERYRSERYETIYLPSHAGIHVSRVFRNGRQIATPRRRKVESN